MSLNIVNFICADENVEVNGVNIHIADGETASV